MIRRLFQKLFGWPCDHEWETLLDGAEYQASTIDLTTGKRWERGLNKAWLYRCKKCCKSRKVTSL